MLADGAAFDRTSFIDNFAADCGRERDAPVLLWLDCIAYEAGVHGGAPATVRFQLRSKRVGAEQQVVAQYAATLTESGSAPELVVIVGMEGTAML
jgi:hypothetical protein